MFIIHRRQVEAGGKRDKVDAVYWILNERIYPSPTLYDIVANRTVRSPILLVCQFNCVVAEYLTEVNKGIEEVWEGEKEGGYRADLIEKRSFPTL